MEIFSVIAHFSSKCTVLDAKYESVKSLMKMMGLRHRKKTSCRLIWRILNKSTCRSAPIILKKLSMTFKISWSKVQKSSFKNFGEFHSFQRISEFICLRLRSGYKIHQYQLLMWIMFFDIWRTLKHNADCEYAIKGILSQTLYAFMTIALRVLLSANRHIVLYFDHKHNVKCWTVSAMSQISF